MLDTSDVFKESTAAKVATGLSVVLVLAFGGYAVWYSRQTSVALESKSLENFLTARRSIGWVNIGWSFYASAVGSWVITAPAEFGYYGGLLGVFAYSFAAGIPILMIAYFGNVIHETYPELLSLSDFILWRFGRMTQILVVLISVFNMSIAATAEYTTLSSLYGDFVGLDDYTVFIVTLIAVVTLSYTAYGGLKASIITDRAQAAVSLFLVLVVASFLAADFNEEDVTKTIEDQGFNASFEFTDTLKGLNPSGYSSWFTLPLSLSTATIFSEALWQRSWAALDSSVLYKGAWMGSILIFIVVSFFGAVGLLVAWANLVENPATFNNNLFAFQVFSSEAGQVVVSSAMGVLVLLLGTTMAEGALDSLQNGIGASINGVVGRFYSAADASGNSLLVGRVVLIVINIPFIVIGLQRYSILSLFLVGNMICVCAFFPISLGFFRWTPAHPYLRDFVPPLAFLLSLATTMIFAGFYVNGDTLLDGIEYAFWGNTFYEYEYFLAALVSSIVNTGLILISVKFLSGPKEIAVYSHKDDAAEVKVTVKVDIEEKPIANEVPTQAVAVEDSNKADVVVDDNLLPADDEGNDTV